MSSPERDGEQRLLKLPPRQLEIILLLAEGMSFKEIADHLGIAFSTVNSHASRAYARLGVKNAPQAVAKIRRVPRAPATREELRSRALVVQKPWLAAYLEAFDAWMASGQTDDVARHAMTTALYGHELDVRKPHRSE